MGIRTDRSGSEAYVRGLYNAYARGHAAFLAGDDVSTNPYRRSDHEKSWRDGYYAAQMKAR